MSESQRNNTESAIEAGKQLATKVIPSPLDNGKPFVVLQRNDGQAVHYIDARFATPPRKTGAVKLNDEASFVEYWKRHATEDSALIYGSISPARFVAVFNDHLPTEDVVVSDDENDSGAGYRDFRATYALTFSKEWQEWTNRSTQKFDGTVAFAEWLENHVPDMVEPPGARMLEIALNLRVTANAAYSKAVRLQDGNTEFTYTNNVEGDSRSAGGSVRIPEQFTIEIPVFEAIESQRYKVEARFRYRLNGSALALWYELVRPHKVVEQAFKDILDRIEKASNRKVLFGSPE